ncbi:MAG: tryptophan 7-halogenase [Alphaproteobacteria bacterium]|nr:FAD-dependent oxidoreductase [Alphaproteobacteria bacterium]MDE2111179.1 tryptophan 7-halogenase [Alphaproteobacteria bacterium]
MPFDTPEQPDRIGKIVIVGGGTAGWMSAALLAHYLRPQNVAITLIESEEIGTVGVGEGTVPFVRVFNARLGIDERDFMRRTQATFKLGIEFRDWGAPGNVHFNGFGDYGPPVGGISPHHYWLKLRGLGDATPFDAYSFPAAAARLARFSPQRPADGASFCDHAYHFDAGLYARYLRGLAEQHGVVRREGKVAQVQRRGADGFLEAVTMEDGERIEGDLFVDCSGFRGLLIEQTLQTGYEDWSRWLPCNRAVAVACERTEPLIPATLSTARGAGWQWRIPLQHRTGNGYVYCNEFVGDEEAARTLLAHLDGKPLTEPRLIAFTTGRRRKFWNGNCVAIGLAAGFMEPLEATSILLIQTAIARLIDFFPDKTCDPVMVEEYNARTTREYERVRDFLILHYCATTRGDTPFWDYCRRMEIPPTLSAKIRLFKSRGLVGLGEGESFTEPGWLAIFLGQEVLPARYDPIIDGVDIAAVRRGMEQRRAAIRQAAEAMPLESEFLARYCREG